ncbi:nuclear transport factor 2 family protein [Streptomyces triticiradicis]|uniref:nuclear transport factor 2 family protein n=1 Tax=Streptomyces triticiradicis TaxID=2651189 RepID=UPI001CEC64C2|nr:nuclear transport factor 2 family protein [Streptomyces triticiradicis]
MLGPSAGRAAVLDFIHDGHTAQAGRVRHHLGNVVVTTTDVATAEARACPMQTRNTGKSIQMISTGVYTFSLRRSDGRWRIAELTLTLDDAFWGEAGQCARRSSGAVPPDVLRFFRRLRSRGSVARHGQLPCRAGRFDRVAQPVRVADPERCGRDGRGCQDEACQVRQEAVRG